MPILYSKQPQVRRDGNGDVLKLVQKPTGLQILRFLSTTTRCECFALFNEPKPHPSDKGQITFVSDSLSIFWICLCPEGEINI